jgi:hypothetical protein
LTYLNLWGCRKDKFQLESFPVAVCRLPFLETLAMSEHPFKEVPAEIAQLTHLLHLRISRCKHLKRLPLSLATMDGIRMFDFTDSGIAMPCKVARHADSVRALKECLRERFTREPRAAIDAVMLARLRDGNPWRNVPRDVARLIGALLMRSAGEVVWHREAPDPDRPAMRRLRKRNKK